MSTLNDGNGRGMTFMVKIVTLIALPFIILYVVYIALSGHSSPGGGFAGGVIVALSLIHIMLAFGKDAALKRMRDDIIRMLIGSTAIIFLALVAIKPYTVFRFEKLILPFCEMAVVGLGLYAIFVALALIDKNSRGRE